MGHFFTIQLNEKKCPYCPEFTLMVWNCNGNTGSIPALCLYNYSHLHDFLFLYSMSSNMSEWCVCSESEANFAWHLWFFWVCVGTSSCHLFITKYLCNFGISGHWICNPLSKPFSERVEQCLNIYVKSGTNNWKENKVD